MADKSDDLIISISTDLTTIKRQLRELGQSVTQSTSGVSKRFTDLGKSIDQSLTPIQKRINQMVGIPVPSGVKEWKGALADVAKETELVTRGFKLNRAGMMELQASGINAFQALASGMSAERVAMMEGAQVIGALVQGTEGLGARLVALATPMNLVVAGIAAAGAAIIGYGVSGGESIEKLDNILKAHKANIALLGDAYDKVAEKQQKAAVISAKTANILIADDARKLLAALKAGISNIYNGATETQLSSVAGALSTETVVKAQFQPFAKALEDLNNSAKDATALRTFLDTVTALSDLAPEAAAQLIHMADGVLQIAQALPGASQPVDAVTASFTTLQEAINKIAPGDAKDKLQDLFDDAKAGKTGIDDVTSALQTLENTNLTLAGPIAALQDLFNKAVAARNALNPQSQLPTLGTVGPVYSGGGKFIDANQVQTDRANATKSQYQIEQEKLAKAARRPHIPRRTADDRFAEDIKSIQARTTALAQERGLLGATYEEQIKRNTAFDLEQKALKEVREEARRKGDQDWQNAQLSEDQKKKIDEVSDAYARQADALKKAQEEMQFEKDIVKGVLDDIHSALEDGKITTKEWGDIFLNVLDKIIDKLENDFIDALFAANNAGGGGGSLLGGIFNGITSLFVGGGGSYGTYGPGVTGDPWAGLRFANGTNYAPGGVALVGERGPELMNVPRGAQIIPNDILRRGITMPSPVRNTGGGPSITYAPTIDARGADSAAVARIQETLARDKAEFSVRVVTAVQKAKKSNVKGI